jgi:pyruvate carboxylase subunit B
LSSQQLGLSPTTKPVVDMQDEDPTKGINAAKATLKKHSLEETDENIFIVASCKEKGVQFLLGNGKVMVRKNIPKECNEPKKSSTYSVELNGNVYNVSLTDNEVTVDGKIYPVSIQSSETTQEQTPTSSSKTVQFVLAPMAGQVLKILKRSGDSVKEGDVVFMLEAMKMEIEVKTPYSGKILAILTQVGDSVYADQKLMEIQ